MNSRKDRFVAAFKLSGVQRKVLAAQSGVDESTIYRWTKGAVADVAALQKCEATLVTLIDGSQERLKKALATLKTPIEGDK